jgi:hypothetical protein
MKPVITRRQAEQQSPIVKVKLSTEPGLQAVILIVGIGGWKLCTIWEQRVNATVQIPTTAATNGILDAGTP